ALLREQSFGGKLRLQALERGEVRADAEALDRERAQAEVAALVVELRTPEDVHALAIREIEAQAVELPARHRHADARSLLRVLEREEHARPALVPAQLRDLALDPHARQPSEPTR